MKSKAFKIGNIEIGLDADMFVIAGPCALEDEKVCMDIANRLLEISEATNVPIMFKGSFDKANRSSISSFRGPGIDKGLDILSSIREKTGFAIVTDVHEPSQAEKAGAVVDCLQVPAFLCRQTDLLVACGETGKAVNIKKGQFVSPAEMKNAVEKVASTGNKKIMLTERGTFFGYNSLVNDMTAITAMKDLGCPVVFDATHSTQQPGGLGDSSAGTREMSPILARSAIAAGANGLFLEVHTDPDNAKCDKACIMPIDWVKDVLATCKAIHQIVRQ
jgi:2-dehydro-3-deoxyphosphooctonate aldolase (KDO 8-P synthase)